MQVVLGRWTDQEVALKIFNLDLQQCFSATVLEEIPRVLQIRYNKLMSDTFLELQVMAHHPLCDHPNIVKLLGISFVSASQLWKAHLPAQSSGTVAWSEMIIPILVVEPAHAEHPDLRRYFQHAKDKNREVSLETKLSLIADIADGVAALHSYSIIHSDLKPENILVFPTNDGRVTAKICDFGFSGIAQSGEPPRGMSDGWEAPERLPGAERAVFEQYRLSTTQDVYAFGLVMAFILLDGNYPFEEKDGWVDNLKLTDKAREVVLNKLKTRLGGSKSRLRSISEVMTECLILDPKKRLVDLGGVRKKVTNK
jgi:serine/threonine protein kinase